jgi:hypothetical protein
MNRVYALTLALGAGLFAIGCDEAADLVREQRNKGMQELKDAGRNQLDKGRGAISESVGDALKNDKEDAAAANDIKGNDEK